MRRKQPELRMDPAQNFWGQTSENIHGLIYVPWSKHGSSSHKRGCSAPYSQGCIYTHCKDSQYWWDYHTAYTMSPLRKQKHTHTHIYIYIYMYTCTHICIYIWTYTCIDIIIYEIYTHIYIERGYLPCIWPATAPESGDSAILILGARSLPSNVL